MYYSTVQSQSSHKDFTSFYKKTFGINVIKYFVPTRKNVSSANLTFFLICSLSWQVITMSEY